MKIVSVCGKAGTARISRIIVAGGVALALVSSPGAAYPIDGIIDSLSNRVAAKAGERERSLSTERSRRPPGSNRACAAMPPAQKIVPSRSNSASSANIETAGAADLDPAVRPPLMRSLFPIRNRSILLLGFLLLGALLIQRNYLYIKRLLDIVGSIIVLSVFSPALLLAAILIKIDSTGPVLITQVRVGVNRRNSIWGRRAAPERRRTKNPGSLFTIFKLRTMRVDAETGTGPVWARENDNRVTRVGRILRKTHIDEIPQFLNVLKGDMCIIGPRPERPVFIRKLSRCIRNYERRLHVKPGITGLAQVRYRYASSIEDTRKKLKYDLLYVNRVCLSLDLRILANTVNTVVMMRGSR